MFDQVLEFHEKFNRSVNVPITLKELNLRSDLIGEECAEVQDELYPLNCWDEHTTNPSDDDIANSVDKVKLTKELCDLLYVVLGTGVTFGLPLKEAFEEVHRSNMSKLGTDGKPILREDGKVLKGENYSPANIEQFFKEVTI